VADCLFCEIAAKNADSDVVKESTHALAFRDINPGAPTHVLVIPKEHLESVRELTPSHGDILAEMFKMMTSIASDEGLEGGFRIVTNTGLEAGQSVSHLHFHLLGGRPMTWPPG
jgi:histidine triad (HIT) family protein